jgi:hypothetical protein
MRLGRWSFAIALWLLLRGVCAAQMTAAQKVDDFKQLAATFAKNYGPLEWKRSALNFDLLGITTWLDRAAATEDDLAFYDLCIEYVASLRDAHSGFYLPSDFRASLPFKLD